MPPDSFYDVLIIGAGPAGAAAAYLLAQRGFRTLLVERSPWPRDKACGGCLNASALALLHHVGLSHILHHASPLSALSIHAGKRTLPLPLPAGTAIARQDLDARLVQQAILQGATFLPHTTARLLPHDPSTNTRAINLQYADTFATVHARLVLAADGLHGTSLAHEPWATQSSSPARRLGFATTLPAHDSFPKNTITMLVADTGYVGIVPLPDHRLHLGAALRPDACHSHHGPAAVIQHILHSTGHPTLPDFAHAPFTGTGPLTTHRPRVAGPRVLALGDAAGYIEPFTGEGIAWALKGALEATTLLRSPGDPWHPALATHWQTRYDSHIRRRQRACRALRFILHRPWLVTASMCLANLFPKLPARLTRHISTATHPPLPYDPYPVAPLPV